MPLRSWAVARMAEVERMGSWVTAIYNYFASAKWSSALLKRILKFAPARSIPVLSRRTMRELVAFEGTYSLSKSKALAIIVKNFSASEQKG